MPYTINIQLLWVSIQHSMLKYGIWSFYSRDFAQIKTHAQAGVKILGPVGIPLIGRLRYQATNLVLQRSESLGGRLHEPERTIRHSHLIRICSGIRPPLNECPRYDTKQSDCEAPVMLEL